MARLIAHNFMRWRYRCPLFSGRCRQPAISAIAQNTAYAGNSGVARLFSDDGNGVDGGGRVRGENEC